MPEPPTQSETQDPVGLQFKVWFPVLPRRGHSLCLIGSLPELGNWDIAHALTAYPTKDSHTWRAEAHLPAHADFTWSWALVRADRPDTPQWEAEGRRRRRLQGYSGVIHSVWGQEEEVFLQAATSVQLTTHRPVDDGQRLVLSGSSPSTGRWDLKEAIAATEFPSNSGYWKAHVIFDAHDVLSFKWAVVDGKKPTVAVAEESLPHVLCGGGVWLAAVAPWDHEEVVVLQRDVTTERDGGRPDVIVAERKRREAEITKWLGTEVSPTKQIVTVQKKKQPSPQPAAISTSGKSKQPEKSEKPFSAEHPTREVKSPKQQARVPQIAKKQSVRKSSFLPRSPMPNAPYSDHMGKSLTQNAANINEAGYTSSGAQYLKGRGQTRVEKEITPEGDERIEPAQHEGDSRMSRGVDRTGRTGRSRSLPRKPFKLTPLAGSLIDSSDNNMAPPRLKRRDTPTRDVSPQVKDVAGVTSSASPFGAKNRDQTIGFASGKSTNTDGSGDFYGEFKPDKADKQFADQFPRDALFSPVGHLEKIDYDVCEMKDFPPQDSAIRRAAARAREQRWVGGARGERRGGADSDFSRNNADVYSSGPIARHSAGQTVDLCGLDMSAIRTELPSCYVDHRANAREMERLWAESWKRQQKHG